MADSIVSPGSEWLPVLRVSAPLSQPPYIKFRSSGDLYLSTDFVRQANALEATKASVFISVDGFRIGLKLHSKEDDSNCFLLGKDGGSNRQRKYHGRILQAGNSFKRNSNIAALLREPLADRRSVPKKDVCGLWVVELAPCFSSTWSTDLILDATSSGIYRYKRGDETVYIGRGVLSSRLRCPDRSEWAYDSVEYSLINSAQEEAKWESYWLERYREKHRSWPVYNRIGGKKFAA